MVECPKDTTPFYLLQSMVYLSANEDDREDGTLKVEHLEPQGDLHARDDGGLESDESGVQVDV